jgi:hypothetical protein
MNEIPVVRVSDGVDMPVIGFGTWQMNGQQAYDAVGWALAAGYRPLDGRLLLRGRKGVRNDAFSSVRQQSSAKTRGVRRQGGRR